MRAGTEENNEKNPVWAVSAGVGVKRRS